jgi:hypothetical protein
VFDSHSLKDWSPVIKKSCKSPPLWARTVARIWSRNSSSLSWLWLIVSYFADWNIFIKPGETFAGRHDSLSSFGNIRMQSRANFLVLEVWCQTGLDVVGKPMAAPSNAEMWLESLPFSWWSRLHLCAPGIAALFLSHGGRLDRLAKVPISVNENMDMPIKNLLWFHEKLGAVNSWTATSWNWEWWTIAQRDLRGRDIERRHRSGSETPIACDLSK